MGCTISTPDEPSEARVNLSKVDIVQPLTGYLNSYLLPSVGFPLKLATTAYTCRKL